MERDLSRFSAGASLNHKSKFALWFIVQNLLFKFFWVPSQFRVLCLRTFGANIGQNVLIKRGVRIHFPWNLTIGDNCWVGEDVWFINHSEIQIGSNVCISQAAIICSSGHDLLSESLAYKHAPIRIDDGAWICLRALALPGSSVGRNAVVAAGEVLSGHLPANHIFSAGADKPIEKLS